MWLQLTKGVVWIMQHALVAVKELAVKQNTVKEPTVKGNTAHAPAGMTTLQ